MSNLEEMDEEQATRAFLAAVRNTSPTRAVWIALRAALGVAIDDNNFDPQLRNFDNSPSAVLLQSKSDELHAVVFKRILDHDDLHGLMAVLEDVGVGSSARDEVASMFRKAVPLPWPRKRVPPPAVGAPAHPTPMTGTTMSSPSMMHSTFISYGGPDEDFARRIHDALQKHGVDTYFFKEHALPGQKLHDVMRDGVNKYDRVILICSKHSLGRPGVANELEHVLDREAREGGSSRLIPIRIDDYVFSEWAPEKANVVHEVRGRVVGNFTDPTNFDASIERLIEALKKPSRP